MPDDDRIDAAPATVQARRGIQSVEVAFRLLVALQASSRPLPLKEVAARAALSPSAANNYLVSLVRTGLAAADDRPGHYRLGPASVALGVSAILQMNGFDTMKREATALRDATGQSAAVTVWTPHGPMSLFKEEGDLRSAVELRTGLLSITRTAAGKVFAAYLPQAAAAALIEREGETAPATFAEVARRKLLRDGFVVMRRQDGTGYTSAAAPVWDWSGSLRFTLSIIGSQSALRTDPGSPYMAALLEYAAAGTAALGGAMHHRAMGLRQDEASS